MSSLKIEFDRGGVFLPELDLWLDPHEPKPGKELVFVSHAHSDHTALHREIIVSEPTSRLMKARLSGQWLENILPFNETKKFNTGAKSWQITLLPAGHIFGSAMSLVEADGSSLLYTGDFKLRPGLSAEPCQPVQADILVMETTYGRPHYKFPPTAEVMKGIVRFCREALDHEETPVLLGYSLGKSQEILCGLGEAGLPIMLHGTVHKMTKIYEGFGRCFPPYEKYDAAATAGKVLLCPPNVANSAMLRNLGKTRVAVITGWAVDPNCRFRYQAHAAFPMSDHADYPDLINLAQQVQPKKVYTLHGFAAEFAQTLRDMGFDAQALSQEDQLSLPLALGITSGTKFKAIVPSQSSTSAEQIPTATTIPLEPSESFLQFAETCARIGSTTKKLEKTELLSTYFKTLDQNNLSRVAVWFTGSPFASSQNKILQLGWALIRDALMAISGISEGDFGQVYLKHSDLGEAAYEILLGANSAVQPAISLAEVEAAFLQLVAARGAFQKQPIFVTLLKRATPLEGKFLVKILTGDLRIGLKEGLVEDSIAVAFDAPLTDVKNANLLLGNIGETAGLARRKQLNEVTLIPFRPIKYMLASPEETAMDIWNRALEWNGSQLRQPNETILPISLPPPQVTVWIEDKYDGIRAQMHKVGSTVAIYSRDLKEITSTFQELADAARSIQADFIIDGEIVAMRGEAILPYADLQRRLGRREGDLFMSEQIPVQFVAFDLLYLNERTYINEPLKVRRDTLGQLSNGRFKLAQITTAHTADDIEAAFAAARGRNNEGLIIKEPDSVYTPGRRGLAWLKLKKAYATLDCVVVGAEYGHGKRKSVLSDYTFAVRDEKTGELKTIGKAYSGLTDAEIADLTQHFLKNVQWQKGRYHAVNPDTVLEIAFDLLQPSARHGSGLAMRFPRILRIRTDKSPAEADTLATAWSLVAQEQ
ncbi:MAG: ATP-dependent DNA ligase [Verrucomicrobiales bacterium]